MLLVVALLGCRGGDSRSSPATKPTPAPVAIPAGSAATGSSAPAVTPAADPWSAAPRRDDEPPDLVERHRRANDACPTVKAPYFYRIEKAGQVSHILVTRHIGVPLSKFPASVHDAIKSAKLAVFEVAPGDRSGVPDSEVSLPDELGPELWQRYRTLVGNEVAVKMERASPAAAAIAMMMTYEDIGAMLDIEIERQVVAAKIPTRGLETSEFQDRLLMQLLTVRRLRAEIQATADRNELADESSEDLAEYCAGTDEVPGSDEKMRADLVAAAYTMTEIDQIDEDMVFRRNAAWIPKLEKIIKDRTGRRSPACLRCPPRRSASRSS